MENRKLWNQIAKACLIFNLDRGFQLFLSAFDVSVTGVPLKVAIGLEKIDIWAFKKIKMGILTSDTGFQLFLSAFDVSFTVVALKVAT